MLMACYYRGGFFDLRSLCCTESPESCAAAARISKRPVTSTGRFAYGRGAAPLRSSSRVAEQASRRSLRGMLRSDSDCGNAMSALSRRSLRSVRRPSQRTGQRWPEGERERRATSAIMGGTLAVFAKTEESRSAGRCGPLNRNGQPRLQRARFGSNAHRGPCRDR